MHGPDPAGDAARGVSSASAGGMASRADNAESGTSRSSFLAKLSSGLVHLCYFHVKVKPIPKPIERVRMRPIPQNLSAEPGGLEPAVFRRHLHGFGTVPHAELAQDSDTRLSMCPRIATAELRAWQLIDLRRRRRGSRAPCSSGDMCLL